MTIACCTQLPDGNEIPAGYIWIELLILFVLCQLKYKIQVMFVLIIFHMLLNIKNWCYYFLLCMLVACDAENKWCSVRLYLQLSYSRVSHTYCVVFLFCFSSSLCSMLPVSLDCPFFIATSVFSNVYLFTIYIYQLFFHRT
jgi:hypothetical protein